MNMLIMRSAAFAVGSAIAGCVYATQSASSAAVSSPPAVAVYPGAHRTDGNPQGDGSDTTVRLSVVTLHIQAARYDTADAPDRVIAFYKKALASFGQVKVDKGGPHTHVRGFSWDSAPDQTTVDAENNIVAVKPLRHGSEFAIIRIDASPITASPAH
jgi:hypothetical protein